MSFEAAMLLWILVVYLLFVPLTAHACDKSNQFFHRPEHRQDPWMWGATWPLWAVVAIALILAEFVIDAVRWIARRRRRNGHRIL